MEGKVAPVCHVCSGVEYYVNTGFFYCTECHTQSLGYRETFLDYQANTQNVLVQRRSVKGRKQAKKKETSFDGSEVHWTSWEGHNFVLVGLVEELISLGARPELKDIALQLWVKYLRRLEVAFTSTTHQILPKFGLNQTTKDYMVIYGQIKEKTERLKKLLLQKKSAKRNLGLERLSADTTLTAKNKLTLAKRLCLKAEYERIKADLASSQDVLSQIDERLKLMVDAKKAASKTKNTASTVKSVEYNDSAKVALEKLRAKRAKRKEFEDDDDGEDLENDPDVKRQMKNDKDYMLYSSCFDSMHLTRQKVLALLALALLLSKDDIQISDLLRWIREGHVSYNKVSHFLPEGAKFTESDVIFTKVPPKVRYKSLEICVADIASLVGVETFPVPDYSGLARRYVSELELPAGLAELTSRLVARCGLEGCDGLVSHEALVVASMLVVLKTLLGLDGLTEHRISEVATHINGLIDKDNKRQLETKLFVWDDWVRYIVCRKSIIMNEHHPTRHRCEDELSTRVDSYVDWWCRHEDKDPNLSAKKAGRKSRHNAHNNRIASMQQTVDALPSSSARDCGKNCPPSLTPQSSYLQLIRSQWSEGGSTGYGIQPTAILTYKHAHTDIEYLVQPERIINFAQSKGVTVEVDEFRADQKVEVEACVVRGAIRLPKSQGSEVCITIEPFLGLAPAPHSPKKVYKKRSKKETDSQDPASESVTKNVAEYSQSYTKSQRAHSKSVLEGRGGSNDEYASSSVHLTLNIPHSEYWIFEVHPRQPDGYFDTKIEPNFPDSFRWLLNECSRLLEMRAVDLYAQVRLIERLCFRAVDLSDLKVVRPAIVGMNRSMTE